MKVEIHGALFVKWFLGPPVVPFSPLFWLQEKVGTLILTSLLEDLGWPDNAGSQDDGPLAYFCFL